MKNNKGFATSGIVIVVLFGIAVAYGSYYIGTQKSSVSEVEESYYDTISPNTSEVQDNSSIQESSNIIQESPQTQTTIVWKKSPRFGLSYQDFISIQENIVDKLNTPAESGTAQFVGNWKNYTVGIQWGGNYHPIAQGGGSHCMIDGNEFGVFQYGVSDIACVKGLVARLFQASGRTVLTVEDYKIFGDFVLKNQ